MIVSPGVETEIKKVVHYIDARSTASSGQQPHCFLRQAITDADHRVWSAGWLVGWLAGCGSWENRPTRYACITWDTVIADRRRCRTSIGLHDDVFS